MRLTNYEIHVLINEFENIVSSYDPCEEKAICEDFLEKLKDLLEASSSKL